MRYVLKLHLIKKIPGVKKIRRIPDIEKFTTKKLGKMYAVKYFIFGKRDPVMIRITSSDKRFDEVNSIDICDKKLRPFVGLSIKPMPQEKFIEFISSIATDLKFKEPIKESVFITENYLNMLMIENGEAGVGKKPGLLKRLITIDITTPEGLMKYMGMVAALGTLLASFGKIRYYIVKMINWAKEKYVSGPLEQDVNKKLFANQTGSEPAYAIYDHLKKYIEHVIHGNAPALIIYGPPGMSKTYTVRRTLYFNGLQPNIDYSIQKGSSLGHAAVYSLLYANRKRILILDDFDTPLKDPDTVNMLKAITDSYGRRILSFPREKTLATAETGGREPGTPDKFEFKGKLIIITNLPKSQLDTALLSRSPAIEVNFNTKEVIDSLNTMYKYVSPSIDENIKKEVYDYMIELYKENPKVNIDFRGYKSAVDARVGCPDDWKNMVKIIIGY